MRMQLRSFSSRGQSSERAATGGAEAARPAGRSEAGRPTARVAARALRSAR